LALKAIAVFLLYVFLGHPSAYDKIWERGNWYVIVVGVVVVPVLLVWAIEVLVWRVRVTSSIIEIRSLRGILRRPISDVANLERTSGRISVAFRDGSRRAIPAIVGDLDGLLREITSRRQVQ
jgi:hypothetical protein